MGKDLTIQKFADLLGVHKNTILNYEKRGVVCPYRDLNNFRRYTVVEILKMKELLSTKREE